MLSDFMIIESMLKIILFQFFFHAALQEVQLGEDRLRKMSVDPKQGGLSIGS